MPAGLLHSSCATLLTNMIDQAIATATIKAMTITIMT